MPSSAARSKERRKLYFELPHRKGAPRFRIVYHNEPLDGVPGLVRVWAVGPRENLIARAATRITRAEASKHRRRP